MTSTQIRHRPPLMFCLLRSLRPPLTSAWSIASVCRWHPPIRYFRLLVMRARSAASVRRWHPASVRCWHPPLSAPVRLAAAPPQNSHPKKKDATASIRPHEHRLVYIIMHISSSLPSTGRCRTSFKKTSLFASIKSSQISAIFSWFME